MKNCLVTGGAGFIGSHVVNFLLKNNFKVVVADNKDCLLPHPLEHKIIVLPFDICNPVDRIVEILKRYDIDTVFHLAAIPRVQYSILHPEESHNANINGTLNLLLACRDASVDRLVFSSSSSVYGSQSLQKLHEDMTPNPMSPYALHKLVGEHYCRLFWELYGLKTISLRYFNVYGSGQDPTSEYSTLIAKFSRMLLNNEMPVINGDGEQTRDFTFIDDVVDANIRAAMTDDEKCFGEAFNIGAGNNRSVNEVSCRLVELSGKEDIVLKHGPSVVEPKHTLADITKVYELLNWKPYSDFELALGQTFEYFKEYYRDR